MLTVDHFHYLAYLMSGLVAATMLGAYLYARNRALTPADRLGLLLCPPAVLASLAFAAIKLLQNVGNDWNSARLAPVVGLLSGDRLYVGPDGPGAIMNTIYPPLAYLVYAPARLLPDPTSEIIAGQCLGALLFFAPAFILAFLPRKGGDGGSIPLLGVVTLVGFFQAALISRGLYFAAFLIHADAPMLAFMGFACLTLYRRCGEPGLSLRTCLISATCASMAVWSKQTAAPMVLALPIWVLWTHGFRASVRYCLCLGPALASCALLFAALFGVESIRFNIFNIPSRHPWAADLPRSFLVLFAEYFTVVAALIGMLGFTLLARWQLTKEDATGPGPSGIRDRLARNPWLLFVVMALASIPTSLLSRIKVGGYMNNYTPTPYFLALGLMALLLEWRAANRRRGLHSFNSAMTFIAFLVVISPLTRGQDSFTLLNTIQPPASHSHEIAYQYSKRHPGTAYFPWSPLSSLLGEGKLYHFEYGMFDRELANFPVSQAQFRKNVPANMRYVCFPGYYKHFGGAFEKTMRYLPEFRRRVEIEELPGWTCYER